MHYIYLIENIINNKIYIGKTHNPNKRWRKHISVSKHGSKREKYYIHKAIKKYGKDNFSFSIIESYNNEIDCIDAERFYISYFKYIGAQLYNLTDGGEGCFGRKMSKETKIKISIAHKGLKHSKETKELLRQENLNRLKNPEYKAKIIKPLLNRRGEMVYGVKLTEKDVIDIREMFNSGKYSRIELSKMFSVTPENIGCIISRRTWKHI